MHATRIDMRVWEWYPLQGIWLGCLLYQLIFMSRIHKNVSVSFLSMFPSLSMLVLLIQMRFLHWI